MHEERTTALWPTLEEFERTRQLTSEAHDELGRISWAIDPVAVEHDEGRSFKELGMLTAFVSHVVLDLAAMEKLLGRLEQARDAVSPLESTL